MSPSSPSATSRRGGQGTGRSCEESPTALPAVRPLGALPLMNRPVTWLVVLASAYVAAQMLADVTSLRIITVFGHGVDAGTLVYPLTFTLRDLVHKLTDKGVARLLIGTAAAINLIMAGLFQLVAALPADLAAGPQVEFGAVLAPVWRIVLASIVAEVISELIDTEAYQSWVNRFGDRHQWGRVLASNAIAIPVDSALFVLLAFWGSLPGGLLLSIFWLNVLIKGAVTLVSIPWIYLVRPKPLVLATGGPLSG